MKTTRQEVYAAIDSERFLQAQMVLAKQGSSVEDKPLECFVLYMEDYMRELRETLSRVWGPKANEAGLNTLRKIVALGVAAMEQHGAPKRRFPVRARINGIDYLITADSSRPVDMFERLFGLPPAKTEGEKDVDLVPSAKGLVPRVRSKATLVPRSKAKKRKNQSNRRIK